MADSEIEGFEEPPFPNESAEIRVGGKHEPACCRPHVGLPNAAVLMAFQQLQQGGLLAISPTQKLPEFSWAPIRYAGLDGET